jgi:predicted amidophosphoribosyltransferase
MAGTEPGWDGSRTLTFRVCLRCARAVPSSSGERYCINDGSLLLEHCPSCSAAITNPYARYCAACGLEFAGIVLEALA